MTYFEYAKQQNQQAAVNGRCGVGGCVLLSDAEEGVGLLYVTALCIILYLSVESDVLL